MQFLLDNLVATLVVGVLLAGLLAQHTRSSVAAVERTAVYAAKTQLVGFAEWVEADLGGVAERPTNGRPRFAASTAEAGGLTHTDTLVVSYDGPALSGGRVQRVEVRYTLAPEPPGGGGRPTTYRLRRDSLSGPYDPAAAAAGRDPWPGGRPAWTETPGYRSPPGLTHFRAAPLDEGGRPAPGPDEAALVRLQISVAPPLLPARSARIAPDDGLHWATTLALRPY